MKVKDLVLNMTYKQALDYINTHPKYRLPTFKEAQQIEKLTLSNHIRFWTSDTSDDRQGVYYDNKLHPAHKNFKFPIVLVLKENAVKEIYNEWKKTETTETIFEVFEAGYKYGH
jgi:predicted transcriptional regulator